MWASDRVYAMLGTRLRVRSQDETVAREIEQVWEPFRVGGTGARPRNTFAVVAGDELSLYRDCSLELAGGPPGVVLRILMEANRRALSEYRGFAAHAAVLAHRERVAAVLADSGAGKSTLAAAGALAGLAYGSDEALCVDRDRGTVEPYPKPLGLAPDSRRLLGIDTETLYSASGEAPVTPRRLGAGLLEPGRSLTDIVIPARSDREPPRFEALSPADGVAALLSNSFNHYRDPTGSYRLTARLASECRIWRFSYSAPHDAGNALAGHLSP